MAYGQAWLKALSYFGRANGAIAPGAARSESGHEPSRALSLKP